MTVYYSYFVTGFGDHLDSDTVFNRAATEQDARGALEAYARQLDSEADEGAPTEKYKVSNVNWGDCFFKVHSEPTKDDLESWSEEAGFEEGAEAWNVEAKGGVWLITPAFDVWCLGV